MRLLATISLLTIQLLPVYASFDYSVMVDGCVNVATGDYVASCDIHTSDAHPVGLTLTHFNPKTRMTNTQWHDGVEEIQIVSKPKGEICKIWLLQDDGQVFEIHQQGGNRHRAFSGYIPRTSPYHASSVPGEAGSGHPCTYQLKGEDEVITVRTLCGEVRTYKKRLTDSLGPAKPERPKTRFIKYIFPSETYWERQHQYEEDNKHYKKHGRNLTCYTLVERKLPDGNSIRYSYANSSGQLVKIACVNRDGHELSKITCQVTGKALHYQLSDDREVTVHVDKLGNVFGRLTPLITSIDWPGGLKERFDDTENSLIHTLKNGSVVEANLDTKGRVKELVKDDTVVYTFHYYDTSTDVVDCHGNLTRYVVDQTGYLVEKIYFSGQDTVVRSDRFLWVNGCLTAAEAFNSEGTLVALQYPTYDRTCNVISQTINGETKTYTYSYDGYNTLLSESSDDLKIVYAYYPHSSLCKSQTTYTGDSVYETENFAYDQSANLTKHTIDGGYQLTTHITYGHDRPQTITMGYDEEGFKQLRRTSLTYNTHNQIVCEDVYDCDDNLAYTNRQEYNEMGLITRSVDGLKQDISFQYNDRGQLISKTTPTKTTHFTYDARGRLTHTHRSATIHGRPSTTR